MKLNILNPEKFNTFVTFGNLENEQTFITPLAELEHVSVIHRKINSNEAISLEDGFVARFATDERVRPVTIEEVKVHVGN